MKKKTISFIFTETILIVFAITCFCYGVKFFQKDHLQEIHGVVVGRTYKNIDCDDPSHHHHSKRHYFLIKPNPGQGLDKVGPIETDENSYNNYDQWKGRRVYSTSKKECLHREDFQSSYKSYGFVVWITLFVTGAFLTIILISNFLKHYDS